MDNQHLCSILLDLQQRLSDDDRERLHFYLKNDVPRSVGDDTTFSGTLRLMQSLFDQDKINDKDFTLLIEAFKQIQCFDAANILEEYQRRTVLDDLSQSSQSLPSTMPPNIQEFLYDHDDEVSIDKFNLNRMNYNNKNYNLINGGNIIINERIQKRSSSQKRCFCRRLFTNKYFLFPFILFLLTLGILIVVLIKRNNCINHLEMIRRMNQSSFWKSENNEAINHSNITTSKNERGISLIKAGRKFGGDGGGDFDDSLLPMFTYSYYLSGFINFDTDYFDSCQFIYTSSQPNQTGIESNLYGWNVGKINRTQKYYLNDNERIEKVQIQSLRRTFVGHNDTLFALRMITRLKFITTNNQSIPSDITLTGDGIEIEYFPGYTLGYVTGKAGSKIDQLQFFWYRTERQQQQ